MADRRNATTLKNPGGIMSPTDYKQANKEIYEATQEGVWDEDNQGAMI